MLLAASASDGGSLWSDLFSVVGYGLGAGIGIAVLFSVALRGLIVAAGARRDGQRGAALLWGTTGVVGVGLCLIAVAFGLVTMLHR